MRFIPTIRRRASSLALLICEACWPAWGMRGKAESVGGPASSLRKPPQYQSKSHIHSNPQRTIEKELPPQFSLSAFVASRMILRDAFFGPGLQWDPDPVGAC